MSKYNLSWNEEDEDWECYLEIEKEEERKKNKEKRYKKGRKKNGLTKTLH